jgi:ParB-like nuclease domain
MTIATSVEETQRGTDSRTMPEHLEAVAAPVAHRRLSDIELAPVALLRPGDSPRSSGVDAAHVSVLAELDVPLPPLIVHRATMRVIDGAHRLRAAVLRGEERIRVQFFDGDEGEAFVLAVETNNAHGLPLSLADRTAAAARILRTHPEWSDRAVAAASGISAGTVRGLRTAPDVPAGCAVRVGLDGKARPVSSTEGRLRAAQLIERSPELSLRAIARQTGISLGTVRDVRRRLQLGEHVVPPGPGTGRERRSPGTEPVAQAVPQPRRITEPPDVLMRSLVNDPSLRLTDEGRYLLRLLASHQTAERHGDRLAASVPPHAVAAVSEVARRCARSWAEFADRLAARS